MKQSIKIISTEGKEDTLEFEMSGFNNKDEAVPILVFALTTLAKTCIKECREKDGCLGHNKMKELVDTLENLIGEVPEEDSFEETETKVNPEDSEIEKERDEIIANLKKKKGVFSILTISILENSSLEELRVMKKNAEKEGLWEKMKTI